MGFLDGYSFAASGIPPLLDPRYKLEADDKFRALHTLAVHHARQRLDAFLWSGNQHMLPRRTEQLSHYACASRTHIFGDGPLIKPGFVQAQKLRRHCPRSALFISASGYLHLALAPCRCLIRMSAELRPNIKDRGSLVSQSYFSGKTNNASKQPPLVATVRQHQESRKSKLRSWTNGPAYRRVLGASEAESAPSHEGTLYVRFQERSLRRW